MRFHLRVDQSHPRHVYFTVFANGANAGTLTMTGEEYDTFKRALLIEGYEAGANVKADDINEHKERTE